MRSKLLNLDLRDLGIGLLMTVGAGVLTALLEVLKNGSAIDWGQILTVALIAGITYILKQLGTNEDNKFAGRW